MQIVPISAGFGATVCDVPLARLGDDDFHHIEDAFHHYAVLVFPAANLSEAEHIAFSRRFGRLERTLSKRTDRNEISLLSNVAADGEVVGPQATLGLFLKGNRYWHTDSSFKPVPAKASLLRAVEAPASGGDTEWADMRAAWDCLSRETQCRLEGLTAVHSYAYSQGLIGGIALLDRKERDDLPPVVHPLVRVHPATGRKSLYLGRHIERIVGMEPEAGRGLVAELMDAACRSPRTFRHRWQTGDIVLWDNRAVLHRGHPWPYEQRRVMKRTTVAGDGDNPWALEDSERFAKRTANAPDGAREEREVA